ncbi:MAG: hypothetical protein G8237_07045 [Magnetococcales bacterium]|nr:hypothetical protein [Magnetococcales bacterium]NGZ06097.1 hypothetical protein [Magnetococcales bacterium]
MNKRLLGIVGVVGLMMVSSSVWAAEAVPTDKDKEAQFQARKARDVKHLELWLSCVKAANNPAELKRCHEAQKERNQSDKLQRIQEERKKLDDREQKLKEQLQEKKG